MLELGCEIFIFFLLSRFVLSCLHCKYILGELQWKFDTIKIVHFTFNCHLQFNVEVTVKDCKSALQLFHCIPPAVIKCKLYCEVTVGIWPQQSRRKILEHICSVVK